MSKFLSILLVFSGVTLFAQKNASVGSYTFSSEISIADNITKVTDLSTLNTLIATAEMTELFKTGGPYTIFAPSNAAFDKLPVETIKSLNNGTNKQALENLLKYHVVPGSINAKALKDGDLIKTASGETLKIKKIGKKIYVNNSLVEVADATCKNGTVHIVGDVQLPPLRSKGIVVGGATMSPQRNVVENFKQADNLSSFMAAIDKSGLAEQLKEVGPYTVFPPSNSAFEKLGADLQKISEQPELLRSILQYHIVKGKFTMDDLKNGAKLKTLNGKRLKVNKAAGKIYVNGALVVTENIQSSNGIGHVLDTVLVPEEN